MGLFPEGEPLTWEQIKKIVKTVRQTGINRFIENHQKYANRNDSVFKWGDEVEYTIVKFDRKEKKVRLSLRAKEILEITDKRAHKEGPNLQVIWAPEAAGFAIEATPGQPYGMTESDGCQFSLSHILAVEDNMKRRRREMRELLTESEALICLSSFPRLATNDFADPPVVANPNAPENHVMKSIMLGDGIYNDVHPRCPVSSKHMRERRGRKPVINVPIFRDTKTDDPFIESLSDEESRNAAKVDHIYMDCIMCGMSCCCLQVTMLGKNVEEAKFIYDELAPLTPILLALTASTPIFKGYLTDRDCRWDVLVAGCDDRTSEELGEKPLTSDTLRLKKSRYDSINSYLSDNNQSYNDVDFPYNKDYYQQMIKAGVGSGLAKYLAYKFVRDPLAIYRIPGQKDEDIDSDIFDNSFPSLRFKPPPDDIIGWRVEFRTMEIQFTDEENTAFIVFIMLLTRAILAFNLTLLMPISKIDENMSESQKRDAINRNKLYFRNNPFTDKTPTNVKDLFKNVPKEEEYVLMTVDEIINGRKDRFPGLVPLIRLYVETLPEDITAKEAVNRYLNLIERRASGELKTNAKWIRDFVRQHKDYKHDSRVNESITYDLINALNDLQNNF